MKAKRPALVEALSGRLDAHHGELARMMLDQIDTLTTRIDELLATIALEAGLVSDGYAGGDRRRWDDSGRTSRRDSGPGTTGCPDHPRRNRDGCEPFPHFRALGVVGEAVAQHHPVRAGDPRRKDRFGLR